MTHLPQPLPRTRGGERLFESLTVDAPLAFAGGGVGFALAAAALAQDRPAGNAVLVAGGAVGLVLAVWSLVRRRADLQPHGEPWAGARLLERCLRSGRPPADHELHAGLRVRLGRRRARLAKDRRIVVPVFLGFASLAAVLAILEGPGELLLAGAMVAVGVVARALIARRLTRYDRLDDALSTPSLRPERRPRSSA